MNIKSNELIKELKDNKVLEAFVNGEIPQSYFIEKYNISRQYFNVVAKEVDETVFDRKHAVQTAKLKHLNQILEEGVALEVLVEEEDDVEIFVTEKMKGNPKVIRECLIRRFITEGFINERSETSYIMLGKRLETYARTIEIGKELKPLKNGNEPRLSLKQIAKKYGVSYSKIIVLKQDILKHGTTTPQLTKKHISTIERNIDILKSRQAGQSVKNIAEAYRLDEKIINQIIKSMAFVGFLKTEVK